MTGEAENAGRSFVMRWRDALRDSSLSPTAKLVGHTLSTYMNAAGETFVGKMTLARGASLSTKTKGSTAVTNAIERMRSAGFLAVTPPTTKTGRPAGRRGYQYRALIPRQHEGLAQVIPLRDVGFQPPRDDEPEIPREEDGNPTSGRTEIPRPGVGESELKASESAGGGASSGAPPDGGEADPYPSAHFLADTTFAEIRGVDLEELNELEAGPCQDCAREVLRWEYRRLALCVKCICNRAAAAGRAANDKEAA
jgi:hypothetical protein